MKGGSGGGSCIQQGWVVDTVIDAVYIECGSGLGSTYCFTWYIRESTLHIYVHSISN